MQVAIGGVLVLIACVYADIVLVRHCYLVVIPAIKSGIFPARGRVYLRKMHPVRFWLCVIFFVTITIIMIAATVTLISHTVG